MTKYLAPLGVFVMGNLVLLVVFLFLGAIGTAGEELVEETAEIAPTFWNWSWAAGNLKFLVFLMFEAVILYATGKAFLKVK